jgi:hypothetical protein
MQHEIVSREEWLQRRIPLLEQEKAFTKHRDLVSAERRRLPWVRVEKEYVFDGPYGRLSLSDMFQGRSQLYIKHFMMAPGAQHQCVGCSLGVDHMTDLMPHLENHDVSYAVVARAQMSNGRFEFQHHKNGVDVSFPVSSELQVAIDAMPNTNHATFLHTKAGNPRSAKALGNDFREWCDKAELPKRCSIHGLRKGCLRILAEAGCNILELQSRSGHLTLSELQKYIDAADKRFAADRAAEKVIAHKTKQKAARKIAA